MSEFPVTIYHNPACGTSRNVVAMAQAAGAQPTVVEYLKVGWTEPQLKDLLKAMGVSARAILRDKGTPAADLGLLTDGTSEAAIIAAMTQHPILVNRPIVVTPKGVALCRPSETVLALLETPPADFVKEDGERVTAKR
jgi:arsenate reductase